MTSHESSSLGGKKQSLTILVDTSQKDGCLLLLNEKYEIVFYAEWTFPNRHTKQLLLEFQKAKPLILSNSVKQIVFVSGPGSFTGLRVGASFVKSLGLRFRDSPIYSINSFKITAFHVLRKLKCSQSFSVCVASIGDMVFRADYELKNGAFQNETVYTDGAQKYVPGPHEVFSPNAELGKKFSGIQPVGLEEQDYIDAVKNLDQHKDSYRVYSHLDLYPLYLRKSEAEEKYSYDKVKL